MSCCVVVIAYAVIRQRAALVGARVSWIELDRLRVICNGTVVVTLAAIVRNTSIAVGESKIRVELNCRCIVGDSVVIVFHSSVGITSVLVSRTIFWIEPDGLREVSNTAG